MRTQPTKTAMSVFDSIQRRYDNAIFLRKGDEGSRLNFGTNQTSRVDYRISLQSATEAVYLDGKKPQQFVLLLDDRGQDGALRVVLYLDGQELPVIEHSDLEDDGLTGQILIHAQSERGFSEAVLHAVLTGSGKDSLIIDSSPKLNRHLYMTARLWKKEDA